MTDNKDEAKDVTANTDSSNKSLDAYGALARGLTSNLNFRKLGHKN